MGQQGNGTPVSQRRASPAACRAGSSGSDSLTSFVLNITLWRLLSVAGSPLRQVVSWYIFTGRSCWALVVDLQRWLWRAVGWMSAPPRSASLQNFGRPLLDVRRWHYGLGESLRHGPSATLPLFKLCQKSSFASCQAQPLLCGAQKLGRESVVQVLCQHRVLAIARWAVPQAAGMAVVAMQTVF